MLKCYRHEIGFFLFRKQLSCKKLECQHFILNWIVMIMHTINKLSLREIDYQKAGKIFP